MYAVVIYNDYRKEQNFEIIATTTDVEYANKIAFNKIKEKIQKMPICKDDECYKIATTIETESFRPINEEIISYRIIKLKKCKNKFKKIHHYTTKYAVVEIELENTENLNEIDNSLICDNYNIVDDDNMDDDDDDDDE